MKTIYKKSLMRVTGTVIHSPGIEIDSVNVHVFEDQGKIVIEGIVEFVKEGNMLEAPDGLKEPFNIVFLTYCPMCEKSYKAELLDVVIVDEVVENQIIKKNCMAKAWVPWEEYILGCGVCAH